MQVQYFAYRSVTCVHGSTLVCVAVAKISDIFYDFVPDGIKHICDIAISTLFLMSVCVCRTLINGRHTYLIKPKFLG